ncbi:hypothetical protein COV11_02910 [Candidatus Woesearchaeota archaeon CG10_big_fil_rev_8_21_14_0_10_30_7]|nr:MAG: hypothetical protein COV11_02910 [Candidatus Woesearchaeota archaeon CG10_big_fil_rev_8_21_14_0_10_30_7]
MKMNDLLKPEEISVIVGVNPALYSYQRPERDMLARTIKDAGYTVEETHLAWPRDHYVMIDRKYVIAKNDGVVGEGGGFQVCDEFILVSSSLFRDNRDKFSVAKDVKKFYPKQRVHVVPAGYDPVKGKRKSYCLEHIDLTCLLVPSKKLLFVDENFYESITDFERVAEIEGLTLIPYKPKPDVSYNYFPLNCLVLPSNEDEILFANKNTQSLVLLLKEHDLTVVEIDMNLAPRKTEGSIRCCTNVKLKKTPIKKLLDYNGI